MARRSLRKRRHIPPQPWEPLVDAVRAGDPRYTVAHYESDVIYQGRDGKRSTSAKEEK